MELFDYITQDLRQLAKLGDSCGHWTKEEEQLFDTLSNRTLDSINVIKTAVLEVATKPNV